jgi:hypothetical protein
LVFPKTIKLEVILNILNEIPKPFSFVVSGAVIVHIPKSSLNGIGSRAVGWQKEKLKPGVLGEPFKNRFCFMDFVVIGYYNNFTEFLLARIRVGIP